MPISNKIGNRVINVESGQDVIVLTENGQSADSINSIQVGGASGGDAFTQYNVSGINNWFRGCDNSDSDGYIISSTAVGSNNVLRSSTVGNINLPQQCVFFAYIPSNVTNTTGAGATYTLVNYTVTTNVSSSFNGTTGVFTAPQDGIYLLYCCVQMTALTAAMTDMSVRVWPQTIGTEINAGSVMTSGTTAMANVGLIRNMTAGQTATTQVQILNGAGNTATLVGSSNPVSYMMAALIA